MLSSTTLTFSRANHNSHQRDQVRQKKLGKALEWDQDKPALDEDGNLLFGFTLISPDALPAGQRYYANYNRRGRGNNLEGRGKGRYTRGRHHGSFASKQIQQVPPPSADDQTHWPTLPSVKSDQ